MKSKAYLVKGKDNYEKLLELGFREIKNSFKINDKDVYTMLAPEQLNFADVVNIPMSEIPLVF